MKNKKTNQNLKEVGKSNSWKNLLMTKKFSLFILVAVLILVVIGGSILAQVSNQIQQNAASISSPSGLKQKPNDLRVPQNRKQDSFTNPNDIPDDIVYGQIFRHLEELNRKADDEEKMNNRDGSKFRSLYKEMAKLSDKQAKDLDRIANQTNQRLKQLDNRARVIIQQIRAKTPGGKLQTGQVPPMAPPELEQLSEQRKDFILQAITELRQNFGEAEFARFTDFVNKNVKSGIKKIDNSKK